DVGLLLALLVRLDVEVGLPDAPELRVAILVIEDVVVDVPNIEEEKLPEFDVELVLLSDNVCVVVEVEVLLMVLDREYVMVLVAVALAVVELVAVREDVPVGEVLTTLCVPDDVRLGVVELVDETVNDEEKRIVLLEVTVEDPLTMPTPLEL